MCRYNECICLNNQQGMTQIALINFHPNKYIEESRYYAFAVNFMKILGKLEHS